MQNHSDLSRPTRRSVLAASAAGGAALLAGASMSSAFTLGNAAVSQASPPSDSKRIFKSIKLGMFQSDAPFEDQFETLKEVGFDGVEIDAPNGQDPEKIAAASKATGFPVDGIVDSIHWQQRLTSKNEAQRETGLDGLLNALRVASTVGAGTVLLVPGHGNDGDVSEIEDRAAMEIEKALPTAAKLGVIIALENVWNSMFYEHDGPADQTADRLAAFVDRFDSPYLGVQFDIGNHQKYGPPAAWIRTLGKRIVKLDVKDWGADGGFTKIGEGDVDWKAVREALADINYTGWAAAEVAGGDKGRMQEISRRMDDALGL